MILTDLLNDIQGLPESWSFAVDAGKVWVNRYHEDEGLSADECEALSIAFARLAKQVKSNPPTKLFESHEVGRFHSWLCFGHTGDVVVLSLSTGGSQVFNWLVCQDDAFNLPLRHLKQLAIVSLERQIPALKQAHTTQDAAERFQIYRSLRSQPFVYLERVDASDYEAAGIVQPEVVKGD